MKKQKTDIYSFKVVMIGDFSNSYMPAFAQIKNDGKMVSWKLPKILERNQCDMETLFEKEKKMRAYFMNEPVPSFADFKRKIQRVDNVIDEFNRVATLNDSPEKLIMQKKLLNELAKLKETSLTLFEGEQFNPKSLDI